VIRLSKDIRILIWERVLLIVFWGHFISAVKYLETALKQASTAHFRNLHN